jgi:hypothetical protein
MALIRDVLGDGREHRSEELEEAAKRAGISEGTLSKARKATGVKRHKAGFDGGWLVSLPSPERARLSPENSECLTNSLGEKDFAEDSNPEPSTANSEPLEEH